MDYPSTLTDFMPTESSEQKTTAYNNLLGAASGAMLYGRNDLASLGLSWAYFGGNILVAGVLTAVDDGAVTLTDDATNYVEATTAGVVSANTSAFTAGRRQLYVVVVADGAPTGWIDYRTASGVPAGASAVTQSVNDASTQIATDEFVHLAVHGRTTFSNADRVMLATERFLAQTGAMSAARQVTLPAANAVVAGTELQVLDESGTLTSTNKITVVRAGADTINGGTSKAIISPYGRRRFVSDGSSRWTTNRDSVAAGAAVFTAASVIFADATGAMTEDNANFYYDDAANLLHISTAAPGSNTTIAASTAFVTAAIVNKPECIIIACSDETTALTAATGKVTFRTPYAFTLTGVRASLTTAQASGSTLTVDINEGGTTILSTKLTIDNTEKTSTTAATPAVISDSALADDAEITIDIDTIGDGTAKGLKVYLIGHQ